VDVRRLGPVTGVEEEPVGASPEHGRHPERWHRGWPGGNARATGQRRHGAGLAATRSMSSPNAGVTLRTSQIEARAEHAQSLEIVRRLQRSLASMREGLRRAPILNVYARPNGTRSIEYAISSMTIAV
jgi:hypothetical protein